jgi:hypothetical protein
MHFDDYLVFISVVARITLCQFDITLTFGPDMLLLLDCRESSASLGR